MNKKELVARIADRTGQTKVVAKEGIREAGGAPVEINTIAVSDGI